MATKTINWNTGGGTFTVTYGGSGNGTIVVASDANTLTTSRSQSLTVKTTKGGTVTKTITVRQEGKNYVDLGLPSGLLWATGNICKDDNGKYYIGAETDWGTYISWGNIIGHNEGEGYTFNYITYDGTPGIQVSADIPPTDTQHDICAARLGAPWHLPTKEDFQELYGNTDTEFVSDYNGTGVAGLKFMKKSDHSVYVFFPVSGYYNGTTLNYRGMNGYYWSASLHSVSNAYNLFFSDSYVQPQYNYLRYNGRSVRPVQ